MEARTAVTEGLKEGDLVVVNPEGLMPGHEDAPGNQATGGSEGLMDLAVYDLKLHKGRFIATIIGVGLLFTIVLAMNGLYRGNIYEGLAVIKATNPDLWVVERFRGGPFNEQSTLPEHLLLQCPGNSRGGEGRSLYLLYGGAPDRQQEPAFQHHRLRRLRRPGRPQKNHRRSGY